MPPDAPVPTDPLHGNNLSGLLNCALDASTIPVSVSEVPENWEPPTPDHIAVLLPQYQIESLIGRGGMGAVYKGRQITLQRPVAIKVLPAELARNTEFVARFHREAQLLASLSHQGIVTIFDFGQTAEGHLYFVMEYVDGTDLYRLIHKSGTQLNAKQALSLTVQICEAMQYAHDKGVVHRDIKPANVLVTRDGRAKLADFGLAMKPADLDAMPEPPKPGAYFDPQLSPNAADMRFTQPGAAMGTPDYAAPEVYDGKADERSDIYALGIMLYEMLTGAPPKGYFQLPSELAPVDHRVDQVVVKALEIDPAARYQKASDMQLAVEAATRPLPKRSQIKLPPTVPSRPTVTSAARVPPPAQVLPRSRPIGWLGKLVVAALMIIGVGAAYDAGQKWAMSKRLLAMLPLLHRAGLARSGSGAITPTKEVAQARAWLDDAKVELTKLQPGQVKDRITKDLAAAYAKATSFDSAFALVPLIGDINPRGRALVQIATEQALSSDFAAALKTAEQAPDPTARGLALVAVAGVQMRQGDEAGARATAAKTSNAAATALFRVEEAIACQRRSDPDGFLQKIQGALALARTLTEQSDMKQAFKAIVVAQTKAGYLNEAKTTATLYAGHRFGNPLLDIIDAQAEMGDFKGAEASFASGGFTMYPACLAVASIADAMADAGRHVDAEANAKRLWYEDHKLAALANVATKAGNLSAARAAATSILTSDHLDGDRSERYARALAPTSALQAKLEGDAVATTWVRALPDPVARCLSFIAMAESKLPRHDLPQVKPIASLPLKNSTQTALTSTKPAPISVLSAPSAAVNEQDFIPLLDKDHLDGWKYVGSGEVKNDNGTFSVWHPHPHSRDTGMYWYATRTFANFVLRLEFMTTDSGVNSGIFLRTPALRDGPQTLWFDGSYEIEILGDETGAIPWAKPKPDLTQPFKANTWNDLEITAQGQDYSVKLNGVLVNKFTGNRNTTGHIAIQSFTDKVNAFRFRNVRIKDLSLTKPRSFTDTSGRVIEGTVVQVKDNLVSLHVPARGQQFVLPLSKFCAADIAYLKGLASAPDVSRLAVAPVSSQSIDVKLDYLAKGAYLKTQAYRPLLAPTLGKSPSSIRKASNDISTATFGDMKALYGEIKTGRPGSERTHAFIWDKAHSNSQRLFVDSNANGDLTDDPPAKWEPRPIKSKEGSKGPLYGGTFQLDIRFGDESHVAYFSAYIVEKREAGDDPNAYHTRFVFYPDYARSGTVTINGKATLAVLTDSEGKGDFSASTNSLLLDVNGDGKFEWSTEAFMIKDAFKLGGTTCEITGLTADGASFQIVKSTRKVGK